MASKLGNVPFLPGWGIIISSYKFSYVHMKNTACIYTKSSNNVCQRQERHSKVQREGCAGFSVTHCVA